MPAALERGHALFQGCSGGVRRPGVFMAASWRADSILDISRGGIDGRYDRAERRIGFLPGVDRSGRETRRVRHVGEPTREAGRDWLGGTDLRESAFLSRSATRTDEVRGTL